MIFIISIISIFVLKVFFEQRVVIPSPIEVVNDVTDSGLGDITRLGFFLHISYNVSVINIFHGWAVWLLIHQKFLSFLFKKTFQIVLSPMLLQQFCYISFHKQLSGLYVSTVQLFKTTDEVFTGETHGSSQEDFQSYSLYIQRLYGQQETPVSHIYQIFLIIGSKNNWSCSCSFIQNQIYFFKYSKQKNLTLQFHFFTNQFFLILQYLHKV